MHVEGRREVNIFVLVMLSIAVVVSLRNLPITAAYGFSSFTFYLAATILFMIPYALISAELASGWPKSGGIYIWVREALGERWGFYAIWMQWFKNMFWVPVMLTFIGASLAQLINPELAKNKIYLLFVILAGFWGVTILNFSGIKTSAWVTTFCVIVGTIIPAAILIILGITWVGMGMPAAIPFTGEALIPDLTHPTNIVFLAGIFLALGGLEANANLAREVKNPQKNFPRAIFLGALCTFIMLAFGTLAIATVIPHEKISLVSGVLDAFRQFFEKYHITWFVSPIVIMIILGALGELNAWVLAGAKGLFVTTEHGSLPPILHKMTGKWVPINLLLFQAIIVSFVSLVFLYLPNVDLSFWWLSAISAQMYLMMYFFLFIAAIVLRYRKPTVHRTYKVPGGWFGIWLLGIVGFLASLFALVVSFIPPEDLLHGRGTVSYEILIICSFILVNAIPLMIYALRKPNWKVTVLKEIRDEIHRSLH
jgi:glutamate:GABA antiporter